MAAPLTPKWKANMKMGSKMIFVVSPATVGTKTRAEVSRSVLTCDCGMSSTDI